MKLSYLDILLSTTTIFVVLYGIMSSGGNLPAEKGKALVMLVVPGGPAGKVEVDVEYLDAAGRILESPRKVGRLSGVHKIMEITIDNQITDKGVITIWGQPEKESTIRVIVRAKPELTDYQRALLNRNPGTEEFLAGLTTDDRRLFQWIKEGEKRAFDRNDADPVPTSSVVEWLGQSPAAGGETLWEELTRLTMDNVRNITRIDLLAYALLVHDCVVPENARAIPKARPNENQLIRLALFRARRHLQKTWGAAVPLTQGNLWYFEPVYGSDSKGLPTTRKDNYQAPGWGTQWLHKPDGGTFFIEDCIAEDVFIPSRGFWSYAGSHGCASSSWAATGSPGGYEAVWFVKFH